MFRRNTQNRCQLSELEDVHLSVPSNKLNAIECENATDNQRGIAMLNTWHEREGKAATY